MSMLVQMVYLSKRAQFLKQLERCFGGISGKRPVMEKEIAFLRNMRMRFDGVDLNFNLRNASSYPQAE